MNEYFKQIERMHEVTGGVDGCYDDPENPNIIIISSGDFMIGGIPKELIDCMDKIVDIGSKSSLEINKIENEKPYYRKFNRW